MKATTTKRVLVTGTGSGIGRDTAIALARGHDVLATTRSEAQAALWKAQGRTGIEAFKLDITDSIDRAVAAERQIDVLVNNAAIGDSGSLAEVPLERIRATFETNLFATVDLTQAVLKGMISRRTGTVIFISSLAGRVPAPFIMPYAMTKFALSAAAVALRQELTQLNCGVHVALVEPGAFHTGFNQKMIAKKYERMQNGSYFQGQLSAVKTREEHALAVVEQHSTRSIVGKIVEAVEADSPRARYTAPWWQAVGIRLMRSIGK